MSLPPAPEPALENVKPNKRRVALIIGSAAAGLALLAAGIFGGIALVDPTASEQYAALDRRLEEVVAERDKLQVQLTELGTEHDTLTSGLKERETALDEREGAVEELEADVAAAETAVAKREKAVGTAEKEAAANTVDEGTWTVGVDIKVGTYRATEDVGSDCYWGIYRSGSNGEDIIQNDIPGGGKPTVTLTKGQDFKTTRCGTWQKKK